jgi:phage terminase small subunit
MPRRVLPQIKKLEGNPGKRPIKEPNVRASGAVFIASHLDKDAKACVEVIRSSMPPTCYAACDSYLITAFAQAWALHREAVIEMNKPGFEHIIQTRAAKRPNPWIYILGQAAQTMATVGDRLGLNPIARARLQVPDEAAPSKFSGLTNDRKRLNA